MELKQLKKIIKECACQAMKDAHLQGSPEKMVKVIRLSSPEIEAGLFPGMSSHKHSHLDYDEDQGEKAMILGNLKKISAQAEELHDLASEVPDNEEWVQEKIAVAASMINSIYNYLKYTDKEDE